MELNRVFLRRALANTLWDRGNQVLYDLCAEDPAHHRDDVIVAKMWIIGRTYAAAIERRSVVGDFHGDRFYSHVVAPRVRASSIDRWIEQIRRDPENRRLAIETHMNVTTLFKAISGKMKPSLASKYLHFHVPEAFFIYDSRANNAIRTVTKAVRRDPRLPASDLCHKDYGPFYLRCLDLTKHIESLRPGRLTPRSLDKVLLALSEARV